MTPDSTIFKVFTQCAEAIHAGKLIRRASAQDKEFHFQNWIRAWRLVSGSDDPVVMRQVGNESGKDAA